MAKPTIGAQLYTVRDYCKTAKDLADTAKKIADIGYTAVQVSGVGPIDPKEIARIMEDNGLTIAATHMGWGSFLNELDKVIEIHKIYKCKHPAIGGLPGEYRTLDGIKRFIDELTPVVEKLAAEGMDFSYHNHNHELMKIGKKTWLATLYEMADPKILKAEIDTYWIQAGGGDPTQWIKMCAGREPLCHFKDMVIAEGREQRFAEIGEGNLNWESIIAACEEGGVEYALIEQDRCYDRHPIESLAISYRNLREMGLS